eukprot:Phypoly_transcript_05027.p1 GENE.Phypoly_transcript_05027~~Phypoly_transcript_05027.p1  ORF type:complete len:678 (+),score=133.86 Phypoly_transcript_05027:294-2036(+)
MASASNITIQFPSAVTSSHIEIRDLQQVVLGVLNSKKEGLPPWLQIEASPKFSKIIMVAVPGIDLEFFNKHKEFMPSLANLTQVITHPPGDKHSISSPITEFLTYKASEASISSEELSDSLEYLILTDQELLENGFPLPDRLQSSSTTTTTTTTTNQITSTEFIPIESSSSSPPSSPPSSPSYSSTITTSISTTITSSSSSSSSPATASEADDHTMTSPPTSTKNFKYSVCVPSQGEWVQTKSLPKGELVPPNMVIVGLDCEMCLTAEGLELTRVSLVDSDQNIIYDKFVVPKNPILDYLTRFSGVTRESLEGVTTDLSQVQREILKLIPAEVALAGHSLENDLIALKMIHTCVIDTSVLFPSSQRGRKNALRFLTRRYLNRTIQTDTHNSVEDSLAVMDLVRYRIAHPEEIPLTPKPFLDVLAIHKRRSIWIDAPHAFEKNKSCRGAKVQLVEADNDADCVQKAKQIDFSSADFVLVQLHELDAFQEAQAQEKFGRITNGGFKPDIQKAQKIAAEIDKSIGEMYSEIPSHTLILVTTSHGDIHTIEKLKNSLLWSSKEQKAVIKHVEQARNALTFFCTK